MTKALQSVINQTYSNTELIVIDNGSIDASVMQISKFVRQYPLVRFVRNWQNQGLNRAFNQALALAKGQFIIDLSADDVLLPDRITKQLDLFSRLPTSYGVVFSNAAYIDANDRKLGYHYAIDARGCARQTVPTGDIFRSLLTSYFICTPTMMMRRELLNNLGGYDETLAYEDFDFWIRSSRHYRYAYVDEVLTYKRKLAGSFSAQIALTNNTLLDSTLTVCRKALLLCQTADERNALATRIQGFIRKAFYAEQFDLVFQFATLLTQITRPDALTRLVLYMSRQHIRVNRLYRTKNWFYGLRSTVLG